MQDFKQRRVISRIPFARKPFAHGRALLRRFRPASPVPKGFRPLPGLSQHVPAAQTFPPGPSARRAWPASRVLRPVRTAGQLAFAAVVLWVLLGAAINGSVLNSAPIARIKVSGTQVLTARQVLELSGLSAGMSMGEAEPLAVTMRIAANSWVDAVDTRRVYPDTVWIDVHERVPSLRVVLGNGRAVLVDGKDVVIAAAPALAAGLPAALPALPAPLPTVRGLTVLAEPGQVLSDPSLRHAREFLALARAAGAGAWGAATIDAHDPHTVTVLLPGTGQRLLFDQERVAPALRAYRLLQSNSLLPIAQLPGSQLLGRTVDLRMVDGAGAGRVIVQP